MNDQTPGWWVTSRHELPREGYPPAGDAWREIERHIADAEATRYRYYVTYPGQDEREVDVHAWRAAELAAGFTPKLGYGHNATGGFSARGYRGRMELIVTPDPDPEDWDEDGTVQARSDELARFLADAGVLARPLPSLGGDGAKPGVWLGEGDAAVIYQILRFAARRGIVIDRESAGLPPLPREQDDATRKVRPSEIGFIAARAGARLIDIPGITDQSSGRPDNHPEQETGP